MINPFLQEWICDNINGALYVGISVGKSKLCCYKASTLTSWIICMCLLELEYTTTIVVFVSHRNNITCLLHSLSHLAAARSIDITFFHSYDSCWPTCWLLFPIPEWLPCNSINEVSWQFRLNCLTFKLR